MDREKLKHCTLGGYLHTCGSVSFGWQARLVFGWWDDDHDLWELWCSHAVSPPPVLVRSVHRMGDVAAHHWCAHARCDGFLMVVSAYSLGGGDFAEQSLAREIRNQW